MGVRLAARGSASWATVAGGLASSQGAVGLTWSAMRVVALSADVGIAHNGSTTFGTVPSPRRSGLSGFGGGLLPGQGS